MCTYVFYHTVVIGFDTKALGTNICRHERFRFPSGVKQSLLQFGRNGPFLPSGRFRNFLFKPSLVYDTPFCRISPFHFLSLTVLVILIQPIKTPVFSDLLLVSLIFLLYLLSGFYSLLRFLFFYRRKV